MTKYAEPAKSVVYGYIIFALTVLFPCITSISCSIVRPSPDLEIITDRSAIDFLRKKSAVIQTFNASLNIKPATIAAPDIDAYLSYEKEGSFRLVGLSPAGFTLFTFETLENQFTLTHSDGRKITGDIDDLVTGLEDTAAVDIPAGLGIVKEAIDFYGSNESGDTVFFIEQLRNKYILNQLRSEGGMAYPLRRWWIDKADMIVVKKEIFSRLPGHKGERVYEVLYSDFRIADDIVTPFEMLIKGRRDNKLVRIKFHKVEYNK